MKRRTLSRVSTGLVASLLLWACGADDDTSLESPNEPGAGATSTSDPLEGVSYGPGVPFGPPESIFERNHIVEVSVEMNPEDWEVLRFEGMSMGEIAIPSGENGVRVVPEYTEFAAQVTVDGVEHVDVAVRKKGYIGSLSAIRPSLKFHFSRFFDEGLAAGMKRMTLNNDRQDPSHARQCLAYDLFAQIGLPAPRCNFAHVVVNGVDLGIYTHIESIKKPMLARFFEDTDGNLYEGELSDFAPETSADLELKTNEEENDRSDIDSVMDALALQDDEEMLAALEQVVDLDSFFDFWALETLLGHWDGYAGNSNNYRAYHDPTTDKFYFIPWGADQTFVGVNPNSNVPYLNTVYAHGAIANRLYGVEAQRDRFRARLGELNDEVWDVPVLLEQVDQLGQLAWDADRSNLEELRSYIRNRGNTLRASLSEPAPQWVSEPPPAPRDECAGMALPLTGLFSSLWSQQAEANVGQVAQLAPESTASLLLDGQFAGAEFQFFAGHDTRASNERAHRRGAFLQELVDDEGRLWFLQMSYPLENVKPGMQPFHGLESNGFLGMFDFQSGSFQPIALVGGGGIRFDEVDLREGQPVTGTLEATAYMQQCVDNAIEATNAARAQLAAAEATPEAEVPPEGSEAPGAGDEAPGDGSEAPEGEAGEDSEVAEPDTASDEPVPDEAADAEAAPEAAE